MDWLSEYLEELRRRVVDRRAEEAPAAGAYARVIRELEERSDAALAGTPTNRGRRGRKWVLAGAAPKAASPRDVERSVVRLTAPVW
jgi:hypothetical protein